MDDRLAALIAAEARARELFELVAPLVVAGKTERGLSREIAELAHERFGVAKHWHKKIVRAGGNTLQPYAENPPDRAIGVDDVAFVDFGPVFGAWEADFGRTFVIGDDPRKHELVADLAHAWDAAAAFARARADITSAELYARVCELARARGWEAGHVHCGHIVGEFPHERTDPDDDTNHLYATNPMPLRRRDNTGAAMQWILEIHFVDRAAGYGGFYEQLLLL